MYALRNRISQYPWQTVKLFGRSVPVALCLLAAIALTAFAGWLGAFLTGSMSVTGGADPYTITISNALIGAGSVVDAAPAQGVNATVSFSPSTFTFDVFNASPGDQIALRLDVGTGDNAGPLFVGDFATATPASWAGEAVLSNAPGSPQCGYQIPANNSDSLRVLVTILAGLDPAEVLASEPVSLIFTATAPTC